MAVVIDPTAPHLGTEQGEPLFNDDGTPSPLLERVKAMLATLQRDFQATMQQVAMLEEAGLLVARGMKVKPRGGAERTLAGFRVVDGEKLRDLEPETLARLHRSGALMLAYAHLISLANALDGVLVKPHAQAASAPVQGFTLSEDDGMLDFSRMR
jgi:hypothetical protein